MQNIFLELKEMWEKIDPAELEGLIGLIKSNYEAGDVVGLGAGRMGYSMRSFIMRCSHLGYSSYMLGDTSLPRVGKNSLVIVNSSSGETPSIKLFTNQARDAGAKIASLTTSNTSSIAILSDVHVRIHRVNSSQLMKTPYEQFSMLLFDHIANQLFDELSLNRSEVEKNHSILE